MEPKPLELLEQKLADYKKAQEKSDMGYLKGKIKLRDNMEHTKNLTPLIQAYEIAIKILIEHK